MPSISSRLDEIGNSLTPKQAVIAWLEQALKFESFDDYCGWIVRQSDDLFPTRSLRRQIEAFARPRIKTKDPRDIEGAVRHEVRDGIFRFYLCLYVQQDFASHSQPIGLWAMLSCEGVRSAVRETRNPADLSRLGTYQYYFQQYALEVFNLKAAIEYIERKFFDGHRLLWKSRAEELNYHAANVEQIASAWNHLFPRLNSEKRRRRRKGARSNSPRELDLDLEALKKSVDPIRWTQRFVDRARADALEEIGDTDRAIRILTNGVIAEMAAYSPRLKD